MFAILFAIVLATVCAAHVLGAVETATALVPAASVMTRVECLHFCSMLSSTRGKRVASNCMRVCEAAECARQRARGGGDYGAVECEWWEF